jgi:ribonucleoside-triphosphate reductase (formate)
MVLDKLIKYKQTNTAKAYEGYRQVREYQRYVQNSTDEDLINLLDGTNEYLNKENSNKDAKLVTTQRDYMAGIMSKDITKRFLMPPDILQADEEGIIHFHDMDYFGQKALHNCDLINLEDMLQNGTVINGVRIDKPHRFLTACTVATQIITAVASSQYGGCTISLSHLAPFVKYSYDIAYNKYIKRGNTNLEAEKYAMEDLTKEIEDGVQTFNYQINSMSTTNGQAPFLSVFMYLGETKEYKKELAMIIEEFLKQRIQGMKNKVGVYVTQAFPKLLYVLEEDNIHENSPYWYLTKLSAQCTAKRLVPDYISEKKMKELKEGNCFPNMGCRSFLAPWKDEQGNYKFYGRFNQGVVTINLPDVAFSSDGNMDKFWNILEDRCELCHRALMLRHKRLLGTSSDVAPILWQDGALARLNQHEPIDKLLFGGYSSISLGYAGLYECVKYMTKQSHSNNDKGYSFGIEIMQYLNNKCEQWKKQDNLGYSLYGSPIESTTYKFAKKLKERFGSDIFVKLDGKDRNYITNSYHIPVFEEINPFDKLSIESKFQELSLGGAISYIECADLTHNVQAVLNIIKFIYDNIMYAELNTKSDYCQVCGYDGEIKIIDENGELIWECPNCKNRDHSKMNVARRTCGYIGSNFWNDGRTDEIAHRFVHLDNHEIK